MYGSHYWKNGFITEFRWEICRVVKWDPLFYLSMRVVWQPLLEKWVYYRISLGNLSCSKVGHSIKKVTYKLMILNMHWPLKQNYHRHEQELMIKKLREDPTKIPTVGRNEIMNLTIESWNELKVDVEARYKSLWLTNALDGTEDSLTSDKMFQLVGHDLFDYREKLTNSESTATLKALTSQITPPKGVRGRKIPDNGEEPDDV